MSIITSTAEKQAAIEFAKAAAMRPRIVGNALQDICREPDIARALFDILEAQALIAGESEITLIPKGSDTIKELAASLPEGGVSQRPAPRSKTP